MIEYNRTDVKVIFSVERIVTVYFLEIAEHRGESHDFWELLYADKGNLELFIDNCPYYINEGEAIFYAPNAFHSGSQANIGAKVAIIGFECSSEQMHRFANRVIKMSAADKLLFSDIIKDGTRYFEGCENGQRLRGNAPEYFLQSVKNRIELLLLSLAFDIHKMKEHRSLNTENHYKGLTGDIYEYLYRNISKRITLDQISAHFGISKSQIKKVFNDEFGCGVITFFNNIKIEEAKNLIMHSTMNFSEIAEYLGFNTIHYFSKLFKDKTGLSPSQYSKSICM